MEVSTMLFTPIPFIASFITASIIILKLACQCVAVSCDNISNIPSCLPESQGTRSI